MPVWAASTPPHVRAAIRSDASTGSMTPAFASPAATAAGHVLRRCRRPRPAAGPQPIHSDTGSPQAPAPPGHLLGVTRSSESTRGSKPRRRCPRCRMSALRQGRQPDGVLQRRTRNTSISKITATSVDAHSLSYKGLRTYPAQGPESRKTARPAQQRECHGRLSAAMMECQEPRPLLCNVPCLLWIIPSRRRSARASVQRPAVVQPEGDSQ